MIAYIKGEVVFKYPDRVIVDNHDIGYEIYTASAHKVSISDQVTFFTYQHIREDMNMLFGFIERSELQLFMKLISVKGIGPKIAMNVIGVGGCQNIVDAIEKQDAAYLKSLPGIGAKASSQIVLDLKGKLVVDSTSNSDPHLDDAVEALKVLGYKQNEINSAVKKLNINSASVDEYVKALLQLLAKKKG